VAVPEIPLNDLSAKQREKAAYIIKMALTYLVDPKNDEQFSLVAKWFIEEGIVKAVDVSRELNISLPTSESIVGNWASGFGRPHSSARKAIFQFFIERSNQYFKQE